MVATVISRFTDFWCSDRSVGSTAKELYCCCWQWQDMFLLSSVTVNLWSTQPSIHHFLAALSLDVIGYGVSLVAHLCLVAR